MQSDGTASMTADITNTSFLRNRANGFMGSRSGKGDAHRHSVWSAAGSGPCRSHDRRHSIAAFDGVLPWTLVLLNGQSALAVCRAEAVERRLGDDRNTGLTGCRDECYKLRELRRMRWVLWALALAFAALSWFTGPFLWAPTLVTLILAVRCERLIRRGRRYLDTGL